MENLLPTTEISDNDLDSVAGGVSILGNGLALGNLTDSSILKGNLCGNDVAPSLGACVAPTVAPMINL